MRTWHPGIVHGILTVYGSRREFNVKPSQQLLRKVERLEVVRAVKDKGEWEVVVEREREREGERG